MSGSVSRPYSLAIQFPDLYRCARNCNASVRDYLDISPNLNLWSPIFRRNLSKAEEANLFNLFEILNGIEITSEGRDSRLWAPSRDSYFSVSSSSSISASPTPSESWWDLWKIKAPPRVLAFAWLTLRNRILTMDNLQCQNMPIVNDCPLCLVNEESFDHLLLHCNQTKALWSSILKEFNCSWVQPQPLPELFQQWVCPPTNSKGKTMWHLAFLACI